MDINKTKKALAIVKAIAYTENGGKPDAENPSAGKTGEAKSIFQFTPDTWNLYSKQVFGKEGVPINGNTEAAVVYHKVGDWLDKGFSTEQIASMWNAGEQKPDAYKQNWKGVNQKYGVVYDTPAYAKKVANYAKQFENEVSGTGEATPGKVISEDKNKKTGMFPQSDKIPKPKVQFGLITSNPMKQNTMKQPGMF